MSRILFFLSIFLFILNAIPQAFTCSSIALLSRDTIKDTLGIDTIHIGMKVLSPQAAFREKQKEYRLIYFWGDNKNPIQINPFGGILINVNKVYNHFSKNGKAARRLQQVFNTQLNMDLINEIWKPYTNKYTPLKGDSLFVFQTYFQPEYTYFCNATHYEKLEYIFRSMRVYRDSSTVIHNLVRLPK